MTENIRWQQRLGNYKQALSRLTNILEDNDSLSEIEEMALIQAFEFSFELAWKTMKNYLESQGEIVPFPRVVIKKAFETNLIDNGEKWLEMLTNRNELAHIYDEATVALIREKIISDYYPMLIELKEKFVGYEQ